MSSNRWTSARIVMGGGVIALVAITRGMLHWQIPYWYLHFVSLPFVFTSAILHRRRIYLLVTGMYIAAHIGMNLWTHQSFMPGSDALQWLSILIAGETMYQISSQRRRAEEISRRRIRELEAMNETLTSISSELDLGKLLQTIVERTVKLLNVSLGELLLYDKKSGNMEIAAQYPMREDQVRFKMKPGEGAMGRVAVTKKPLILNDYKAFVHSLPDEVTTGVEATMDVPLLKGGEFIGVLGVARHERYPKFLEDDLRLLTVLASQVTIAIENARLYEEVQHLAFTDMLTGINNRRRLFELAEKEYKRSTRYHRPLSFMLVDIDHFKSINDRYGHAAGDEVLRWFASESSAVIRQKIDVIGRFGGEEFLFLYPETELPSAIGAEERLRRNILGRKVSFDGTELQVTFSAGIASMPLDEEITLDQLIERADKALYHAKQKRNCMAYWDGEKGEPCYVK